MAQLGDLDRARILLRSAACAFGPKEAVARARCVLGEAEIALVSRNLIWPVKALAATTATLEEHGDRINAAYARYLAVRRLLLIGRLDEAQRRLADLAPAPFPPALRVTYELVLAGIALRRIRTGAARTAPARAAVTGRAPILPPRPAALRVKVRKSRAPLISVQPKATFSPSGPEGTHGAPASD